MIFNTNRKNQQSLTDWRTALRVPPQHPSHRRQHLSDTYRLLGTVLAPHRDEGTLFGALLVSIFVGAVFAGAFLR